jgi:hypothetical protein
MVCLEERHEEERRGHIVDRRLHSAGAEEEVG